MRLWTIDGNGDLDTSGYYVQKKLYKTSTKDENWTSGTDHSTEEFKDKQGRVVLKRTYDSSATNPKHDTYYVYDKYGNLSFVLPPKAEGTTSTSISSTVLTELCYQYKYDQRNRLIEKQIPGKGKESIVYDVLDRPVLTQDTIQAASEWMFTKYDGLGRVIYTGIYSSGLTRASLQTTFNGKTDTALYETKLTSSGTLGIYYSNSDFPTSSLEVLTVNYYDNYTFDISGLGTIPTIVQGATVNTAVARGLATGSKVKVLDQSPIKWVTTAIYYDNNARTIYTTSDNSYLDTQDKVEMELDFRGKVTKTVSNHVKGTNAAIVIEENFDYDDMGRLISHKHKKDAMDQETLAINTYDELGQLIIKGVGNISTSGTRLQTINYNYNIRGWLKQINDVNNLGNDLFAFKLNYNDIADVNKELFNGNISQTLWKTANTDGSLKDYEYTYDALNRITNAVGGSTNHYDLDLIQYDKNGNITKLERQGHTVIDGNGAVTNFGTMDNLVYTYYSNSNRLKKVLDNGNDTYGFKDVVNLTTEYVYDTNGNLIKDLNKGIGTSSVNGITYNHLNLPTEIKFDNSNTKKINYTYSADGIKLKKVVNDGGNLTTTDYANGYIYENNTLQFFNHPEGYILNDNGTFKYVYQYKDHLGNVRLSYNNIGTTSSLNLEILEENNYYPFGLKHKGYNNVVNGTDHKYEFQGQEIQDELGLNWISFKWRNHDPAIGRFFNIDPLAEDYVYNGTYNFSENRVIDGVELEGLEVVSIHGDARASFLFTGSISAGIAFDLKGNVGLFSQPGIGFGAALGATAGGGVSVNPWAETIYDVEGAGVSLVAGGSLIGGASVSLDFALDKKGLNNVGGTTSAGFGGEIVLAGEFTATFMNKSSWGEIANYVSNSTDEFFRKQIINGLKSSVNSLSDQMTNKTSAFDILVAHEKDTGESMSKEKTVLTNEISELARAKVNVQNTIDSINK